MKFYLIFSLLVFNCACRSKAIVLIDSKQEDVYLLKGKLSFIKKGTKEEVYMIAELESENLNSTWMYIENKEGSLYKKNPIKINFDNNKKTTYGLLSNNWCLQCKDFNKELAGKKVIFLDEKKNIIKISDPIKLK
jgi:hypothetical protein